MKVLCPKDGQIMCPVDVSQQSYECFVCHYVWSRPMKETKKISNYQVGSLHKYISLVFIVALSSVFLLSVQMSKLSSFADTQTIEKSVKLSALIIWWIILIATTIIITTPMTNNHIDMFIYLLLPQI